MSNSAAPPDLPSWRHELANNADLTELQISFDVKAEDAETSSPCVRIGQSSTFGNFNRLVFAFDPENPEMLRVSFNKLDDPYWFVIEPTLENLREVSKNLILPGAGLPGREGISVLVGVRASLDAKEVSLVADEVQKFRVFMGMGDWDDMVEGENTMCFNPFNAMHPMIMATAQGNDGSVSQYYTAFSRSLADLIRRQAYGTCMYFLAFEYVADSCQSMKKLKEQHPDNQFFATLPDDIPADIAGLIENAVGKPATKEQVLGGIEGEDFNSLLVLCTFSDLDGDFVETFLPLANHANQEFRDQIAKEAFFRQGGNAVIDAARRAGITEECERELLRFQQRREQAQA